MGKLRNYTTEADLDKTVAKLQKVLGEHGAKRISFDYADNGTLQGISFGIMVSNNLVEVKLPAKVDKAQALLKKLWDTGEISHKRGKDKTYSHEQATKVAWANILMWVEAQMALLDIEMVKMQEVFLPYIVNKQGMTLYEVLEADNFQHLPMLASGPIEGQVVE